MPDIINGLFELFGSYFTWMSAIQLYRDKRISGMYWPSGIFFATWGLWNLYFYPALGQWFSFSAGLILVLGQVVWVFLLFRYRAYQRPAVQGFHP